MLTVRARWWKKQSDRYPEQHSEDPVRNSRKLRKELEPTGDEFVPCLEKMASKALKSELPRRILWHLKDRPITELACRALITECKRYPSSYEIRRRRATGDSQKA